MLESFRDATPLEFAAFFELGEFITGDVEAVSKLFLEQGYDGESIANLAFDLDTTGLSKHNAFRMALKEAGVFKVLSHKESIWVAVRYFLQKIIATPNSTIDGLSHLIDLDSHWGNVELFQRPDYDAYFEKHAGSKFAAQGWGIENLYSTFYDDYNDWHDDGDNSQSAYEGRMKVRLLEQGPNIVSEAKRVLEKFYSLDSDLPDFLDCQVKFYSLDSDLPDSLKSLSELMNRGEK